VGKDMDVNEHERLPVSNIALGEASKQDRLNRLRSPMTEGREPNVLIFITING
jgi:hypothetical protein